MAEAPRIFCTLADLERDAERYRKLGQFADVDRTAAAESFDEALRAAQTYRDRLATAAGSSSIVYTLLRVDVPSNFIWTSVVWLVEWAAKRDFVVERIERFQAQQEHGCVVILFNVDSSELEFIVQRMSQIDYVEPADPASLEPAAEAVLTHNPAGSASKAVRATDPRVPRDLNTLQRPHQARRSAGDDDDSEHDLEPHDKE